jgi:hypothetical protein
LLLPLYPGGVYTLGFDLAELVAAAFMVGALLAIRRNHVAVAVVAATFATLTRETALVLPFGLVIAGLWPWWRRPDPTERRVALTVGLAPIVVFGLWQVSLRARWGTFPLLDSGDENIVAPFAGLVDELGRFLPPTSGAALLRVLSLAFLVVVFVTAVFALRRSTARRHEKVSFVVAVLPLPLLIGPIWGGATSFMRASTEAYMLAIVVLLSARVAAERLVVGALVATFGATVVAELVKAG